MSTYYPVAASGSTFGNGPVLLTVTSSTAAQTIHTCTTSTGPYSFDEVYMKGYNGSSTGAILVTIQLGSSNMAFKTAIASQSGWVPLLNGARFNSGLVLSAFAATTNAIQIHCDAINRIST
jgi:hypothetical protein